MKKIVSLLLASTVLAGSAMAWQPTKPVEVLIGHGASSGNEVVFRALAAEVEKNTGANFVIINKVGAGGALATRDLADKPADGHNIGMMVAIGIPTVDRMSIPDPVTRGYDIDSFTYVMLPAFNQFSIIANPKDSIKTPKDLVQALANEPVTFVAGGGARLVYESFRDVVPFKDVVHLNDKGPVHAVNEIMGGHARIAVVPTLVAAEFHRTGRINIVATTGPKRLEHLSGISTVGEAAPGFLVETGWGIIAPGGLPKEIHDWYVREFERALASDSVKKMFKENNVEIPPAAVRSSEGYRKFVVDHQAKHNKIVERFVKELPIKK